MRNVFLSYQIFDFIAIFRPFYHTPQKIVAQKPKTISSKEKTTLPGYPHLHLSLSIGAVLQGSADPLEEAVHRADSLMYQAKAKKNAIVLELLDINVPVKDGFAVLQNMTRNHAIEDMSPCCKPPTTSPAGTMSAGMAGATRTASRAMTSPSARRLSPWPMCTTP